VHLWRWLVVGTSMPILLMNPSKVIILNNYCYVKLNFLKIANSVKQWLSKAQIFNFKMLIWFLTTTTHFFWPLKKLTKNHNQHPKIRSQKFTQKSLVPFSFHHDWFFQKIKSATYSGHCQISQKIISTSYFVHCKNSQVITFFCKEHTFLLKVICFPILVSLMALLVT